VSPDLVKSHLHQPENPEEITPEVFQILVLDELYQKNKPFPFIRLIAAASA
jgi:hypothetical protein